MIGMEILKPLAVLAGWTMIMWIWMYVTRIPAMGKAGIDSKGLVGGTGKNLDEVLPYLAIGLGVILIVVSLFSGRRHKDTGAKT